MSYDEAQKLAITCSVSKGSRPLSFEWFKNGNAVSSGSVRITNDEDLSILKVDSVNSGDAGNYTCKASNSHGSDTYNIAIHIKSTLFTVLIA